MRGRDPKMHRCHLKLFPGVISWWFCESVPFSVRRKRRMWEAESQVRLLQNDLRAAVHNNPSRVLSGRCLSCFHTGLSGPFESQSPGGKGNVCVSPLSPPGCKGCVTKQSSSSRGGTRAQPSSRRSCNTSHELQQLLQGSSCTTSGLVVQKQSPSSVKAKLRGGKKPAAQLQSQLKSQMTAGSLLQLFNLTVTGS